MARSGPPSLVRDGPLGAPAFQTLTYCTLYTCYHTTVHCTNDCCTSTLWPCWMEVVPNALQWHHNGRDSISNHQSRECLLSRLIRRRSKKTSKLHVTGLCAGNSPETGEFPAKRTSNVENVSIWWHHGGFGSQLSCCYLKEGLPSLLTHKSILLDQEKFNKQLTSIQ